MRIHTLVLVVATIASHSTIWASADSVCTGSACQQENKVFVRRLVKRQEPPPESPVPTSDFNTEVTPTVFPEPSSETNSFPPTSVHVSETFSSPLESSFNSLEPTFDSDSPEPTFDSNSPEPTFDSNSPEPTFDSNSPEPTFDSDTLEPTFDSNTSVPTTFADPSNDIPTSVPSSSPDVNDSEIPTITSLEPSPTESPSATEIQSPTSEVPSSPTEAPSSPTEVPSSPTEAPSSPTEVPSSPTEIPPSSSEVPPSITELPSSTDEFPTSATEIPTSATESSDIPQTSTPTSEIQPTSSEIPPESSLVPPPSTDSTPPASSDVPTPTSSTGSSSADPPLPSVGSEAEKKESGGNKTGAIVGGVVGGVAFIAAIAGFIGYRYHKKKKQFADVNFDFDDIAMSSPPPAAGFTGGARLNAVNSTSPISPHNNPVLSTSAGIGAGVAAATMAKPQKESYYRPPSPNDYPPNSRQRQDYTHSQVSSQPSFVSTDAFIGSAADQNQRNRYSPERPSNNRHNVTPTPYDHPNQYYNSENTANDTRLPRSQEQSGFSAPQPVTRQDNNRLAPALGRDNTLGSSVTSSNAGPGINEADLEETVIVGFDRNEANRSNTSLSNHSLDHNSGQGLRDSSDLPLFTMTAIEPYMPERPNELLVQPDDELIITEEVGDQWFIGYNRTRNPDVKGYFPRNCVVGGYY